MSKDTLLFLIGKIHFKADKLLTRELNRHGITGIAPSHGEILGVLTVRGPLMMKDIAKIIDKDKSTVTALINKLIERGYVAKSRDNHDSRISIIELTQKGKSISGEILKISQGLRKKAYNRISDQERDAIYELLSKIHRNFGG
ncbi:MAG TPA: MarR family transcriptional regulator [Spirochaetota bacterium]|nr:MarR family transcriptional regulator [Spirochaetota bacterium]